MTRADRAGGERAEGRNVHTDACNGSRCPCYVEGQNDLAMAIRTMQRLDLPLDDVLADRVAGGSDAE